MIGSDGIEIRKMYIKYIYVTNEVSHFARRKKRKKTPPKISVFKSNFLI
jgi:hypothetical protein